MMHGKRAIVLWGAAMGVALGVIVWSVRRAAAAGETAPAQSKAASSSAVTTVAVDTAKAAEAPKAGEKIVHTFEDAAKMEEFKKVWQQRQGVLMRMSVLQAYWNEEQTLLDQLNHTLSSQYGLDVAKTYSLDGVRRVLIEQEAPPAPSPAAPMAGQATPGQSTPSTTP